MQYNKPIANRMWALAAIAGACMVATPVMAQKYPVTATQKNTAQAVAEQGVPVEDLAPNAPNEYKVKSRDTLWAISGIYLKTPWRWPALWGMNLDAIKNPHLIYPGQMLYLIKKDGRAMLSTSPAVVADPMSGLQVTKLSPSIRSEGIPDDSIPTLSPQLIEPFLVEPVVVDELTLTTAPRLVAVQDGRVMISKGDRAYARSSGGMVLERAPTGPNMLRVFRDPKPLKDPSTQEILGYEAQYLGRAQLIRNETKGLAIDAPAGAQPDIVPATVDIVFSKEEMRVGDRLLPEADFEFRNYTPKAPSQPVVGRVMSIYGSSFVNASQNQVLAISKGGRDGLVRGDILAILTAGERLVDKTNDAKDEIRLPNERNGLAMVFRVFDKVSYVLVLNAVKSVRVGDYLTNPREQ